jgi:NAD(P)H-flavin reductase
MSDWFEARVVSNRPAADGLVYLDLEVGGSPAQAAYRRPGQYVKLSLEGLGESPFAIASAPDSQARVFEFLLKGGSPLADALAVLPVGAKVRMGKVEGRGFPLERARGKRVLLFATGSGISALRSLIELIRRDRSAFGDVTLYFGVRTPDAFAYAEELDGWEGSRIQIRRTVSQPGATGWQGLTGYVQAHVPRGPLEETVAFLCGQKEMVAGVSEVLAGGGVPQENIFLNY